MATWEGKRPLVVVTACTNAAGLPDFVFNEVEVTQAEYEEGVHYDLVAECLADARYEQPFVHFDEFDSPAFLIPAVRHYLGVADGPDPDLILSPEYPDAPHH